MSVGRIDWVVPDNKYFFTFYSWKDKKYLTTVDSDTEKKNEQFVESLCKKYKLIYWKGDSVCGDISKEPILREVRNIISECMPVGQIKFAHPDNVYYFTFKSWKTNE